jgi:HD-like signal output (HDOD) protein
MTDPNVSDRLATDEGMMDVVFVDDEPRILDGLRRQLRGQRGAWDMRFALSGEEALRMLAERPADVVVSDMRMPGMSGGALLQAVLHQYPATIRIVLSGQVDPAELVRELGPIHQYLQKPCDPQTLAAAIRRTWRLARLLRDPRLRAATTQVTTLPPFSDTHEALVRELVKPDASVEAVAEIVGRDPALIAKVMQLVNSAFFGTPRRATSVQDAVVRLGLKTIHAAVVSGRLFDFLTGPSAGPGRAEVPDLWNTSLAIGDLAGTLAVAAKEGRSVQQQARLAGVLSLVGRAVLMTSEPTVYGALRRIANSSGRSLLDVETAHFRASQDDVGAYALGLWGFADDLVEAVAHQTVPSRLAKPGRGHPLPYLHLARVILGGGAGQLDAGPPLDEEYVDRLGLTWLVAQPERAAA